MVSVIAWKVWLTRTVSKDAFIDMPEKYALFSFYKPQEGRSVREDTYLFVSPNTISGD
jgi:hypothetical protein